MRMAGVFHSRFRPWSHRAALAKRERIRQKLRASLNRTVCGDVRGKPHETFERQGKGPRVVPDARRESQVGLLAGSSAGIWVEGSSWTARSSLAIRMARTSQACTFTLAPLFLPRPVPFFSISRERR